MWGHLYLNNTQRKDNINFSAKLEKSKRESIILHFLFCLIHYLMELHPCVSVWHLLYLEILFRLLCVHVCVLLVNFSTVELPKQAVRHCIRNQDLEQREHYTVRKRYLVLKILAMCFPTHFTLVKYGCFYHGLGQTPLIVSTKIHSFLMNYFLQKTLAIQSCFHLNLYQFANICW